MPSAGGSSSGTSGGDGERNKRGRSEEGAASGSGGRDDQRKKPRSDEDAATVAGVSASGGGGGGVSASAGAAPAGAAPTAAPAPAPDAIPRLNTVPALRAGGVLPSTSSAVHQSSNDPTEQQELLGSADVGGTGSGNGQQREPRSNGVLACAPSATAAAARAGASAAATPPAASSAPAVPAAAATVATAPPPAAPASTSAAAPGPAVRPASGGGPASARAPPQSMEEIDLTEEWQEYDERRWKGVGAEGSSAGGKLLGYTKRRFVFSLAEVEDCSCEKERSVVTLLDVCGRSVYGALCSKPYPSFSRVSLSEAKGDRWFSLSSYGRTVPFLTRARTRDAPPAPDSMLPQLLRVVLQVLVVTLPLVPRQPSPRRLTIRPTTRRSKDISQGAPALGVQGPRTRAPWLVPTPLHLRVVVPQVRTRAQGPRTRTRVERKPFIVSLVHGRKEVRGRRWRDAPL